MIDAVKTNEVGCQGGGRMDKERMFESFLANPYWKKYYDEAPSEKCKEYIKWIFICSDEEDIPEEDEEQLKAAEDNLYYSDLEYLIEHEENAMARSYFKKKLEKAIMDTAIKLGGAVNEIGK